jgi:hypothetical protein
MNKPKIIMKICPGTYQQLELELATGYVRSAGAELIN